MRPSGRMPCCSRRARTRPPHAPCSPTCAATPRARSFAPTATRPDRMPLSSADFQAIALTLRLALATTFVLLLLATPLAWWLAHARTRWSALVGAAVALPLVLPPTVLGFYLLVVFGPQGWGGRLTQALGLGLLPFTFAGLLVASVLYSL